MSAARPIILNSIELATEGGAPEWVQLTPAGPDLAANDGRKHRLSNPAAVVAAFRDYGLPIPIDVEHATHVRADQGLEAPAYGWVRELEVRAGALWGRVEWLAQGAEWVKSKAYKFLSIGYGVEKATGEITKLLSVGLTNTPGFKMPELAKAGDTQENETMDKTVLEALGLASSATAADAVVAIHKLKEDVATAKSAAPDGEKFVSKAQHDAALARITSFEEAETARADAAATAAVETGIAAGKIVPAAKDDFIAIAKKDGAEAFAKKIEGWPQIVKPGGELDGKDPATAKTTTLTEEEKSVAKAMGMTEAEFAAGKADEKET